MRAHELERYVAPAEPRALLCTLAQLTGDRSLLDASFGVPVDRQMIALPTNGGLDEPTHAEARRRSARALTDYFDNSPSWRESREPYDHADISVDEILNLFVAGDPQGDIDMLREQLGQEVPSPGWTKDGIDADRDLIVGITALPRAV